MIPFWTSDREDSLLDCNRYRFVSTLRSRWTLVICARQELEGQLRQWIYLKDLF